MKPDQVRRHFAETAKSMILEEGVESVSIRKIAGRAEYAYASIYNHFRNLDELLWYARSLIIEDMAGFLSGSHSPDIPGAANLKAVFHSYLHWFLEHPHAYRFLYFHQLDRESKTTGSLADEPDFDENRAESFSFLAEHGWRPEDREILGRTLILAAQGMLTLAVTGNDVADPEQVYREMDELIDFMLEKKGRRK